MPIVSPVTDPRINGQPLVGNVMGVGLTPTLSWSAPAIGTPTAYRVNAINVTQGGGFGIVTTTTSLPIPPGLLQAGASYGFQITACVSPIDASTKPLRNSPTFASADAFTAGLASP